jgi:hypothetical protein
MSCQNIPLKGPQISGDLAEFRPQRLFAFELRRWKAQLAFAFKYKESALERLSAASKTVCGVAMDAGIRLNL